MSEEEQSVDISDVTATVNTSTTTSDDATNAVNPSTISDDATDAANTTPDVPIDPKMAARAKAEARRRRILEKSNQRLGLVSGEGNGKPKSSDAVAENNEDGGETTSTSTKLSSSKRIQAMRRRRYGKSLQKSQQQESASSPEESKNEETKDRDVAKEAAVKETISTTNDTTTDVSNGHSSPVKTAPPSEKRKYRGVAATRRLKLKEKAAKKNTEAVARSAEIAPKVSNKLATSRLPIVFYIFTIFVLFGVGFKIGIDQVLEEQVLVHPNNQLAPQQYGIGLLKILDKNKSKIGGSFSEIKAERIKKDFVDDEFGGDNFDDHYEPNIDPLFGIDLDVYAQGDSIFMTIARFAIFLHRINLRIFYYLPLSILTAIFRIPAKLMQTPPILCLVGIGVRQFAKRILGAGLPEEIKQSDKKDVLGMIKNGVVNYITKSFPTVVQLYDLVVNLRSDFFIILCGLFVGLAWNNYGLVGSAVDRHDEL